MNDAASRSIILELGEKEEIHLFENTQSSGSGSYWKSSGGIVSWINSARQNWALNQPDADKGLYTLYIICIMIIIGCIATLSTVGSYMINIYIHTNFDGTYKWNLGWFDATFSYLNDAQSSQSPFYRHYSLSEIAEIFAIPNTIIYMKNAGYLLSLMSLVCIILTIFILFLLCYRSNIHRSLYLKCYCCIIPQQSSIYISFKIIQILLLITIIYYILLMIYATFETYFYISISNGCPPGNICSASIIPHYGFISLLIMLFSISFCCIFNKIKALDIEFSEKTLNHYFPANVHKSEINNKIKLKYLFLVISYLKYIIILSFIMIVSFRDSGLISIYFHDNNTDELNNVAVVYFQFQGLRNNQGITQNEYLKTTQLFNTTNSTVYSDQDPDPDQSQSVSFEITCDIFYYFLCLILLINLFIILPYIWCVIHKYHSIKCFKFVLICIGCIELLCFPILMILYYSEYNRFFKENAQLNLEDELEIYTGNIYDVQWFPDWGIFICIVLWYYISQFTYYTFKGM